MSVWKIINFFKVKKQIDRTKVMIISSNYLIFKIKVEVYRKIYNITIVILFKSIHFIINEFKNHLEELYVTWNRSFKERICQND